ncbi:hypothetical protein D3C87_1631740 [compost metagenome]
MMTASGSDSITPRRRASLAWRFASSALRQETSRMMAITKRMSRTDAMLNFSSTGTSLPSRFTTLSSSGTCKAAVALPLL